MLTLSWRYRRSQPGVATYTCTKPVKPSSIKFRFHSQVLFALALFDSGLGHLSLGSGSSTSASWRVPAADTKRPRIGAVNMCKVGSSCTKCLRISTFSTLEGTWGWVIWRLVPASRRQQVEEYLQLTQNDHKSGPSTCAKLGQVAQSVSRISMFSTLEGHEGWVVWRLVPMFAFASPIFCVAQNPHLPLFKPQGALPFFQFALPHSIPQIWKARPRLPNCFRYVSIPKKSSTCWLFSPRKVSNTTSLPVPAGPARFHAPSASPPPEGADAHIHSRNKSSLAILNGLCSHEILCNARRSCARETTGGRCWQTTLTAWVQHSIQRTFESHSAQGCNGILQFPGVMVLPYMG